MKLSTSHVVIVALLTLTMSAPIDRPAHAAEPSRGFLRSIGQDVLHFFKSTDTAKVLVVGASLGWAATGVEDQVVTSGLNLEMRPNEGLDRFFEPGEITGLAYVQFGGALTTLAVGKLAGKEPVFRLGQELFRAQLLNGAITGLLKRTVSRTRPDGSNNRSFPSGHSSGTFAAATVLHRNLGWKAGAVSYLVAAYVATSRMGENKHYLSDVTVGAALGIAAGLAVTRSGHEGWSVLPSLTEQGVSMAVSIPLP